MEQNRENVYENNSIIDKEKAEEEFTPKLFSDDQGLDVGKTNTSEDENETQQLFDQNEEEEDFEIPAFLRRQKF